jgi:hypothetical protein
MDDKEHGHRHIDHAHYLKAPLDPF